MCSGSYLYTYCSSYVCGTGKTLLCQYYHDGCQVCNCGC